MSLTEQISPDFENLCESILYEGKLILMGIGKSGHIAQERLHYQALELRHFSSTPLKLRMGI